MLQAQTTESKQPAEATRTAAAREPQRTLHPRYSGFRGVESADPPGSRAGAPQVRRQVSVLQRALGNQAMLRLLSRSTPAIQAKLTVNQPGDRYEQEADRVAEQVMRMPDPVAAPNFHASPREEVSLQRTPALADSSGSAVAPPIVHEVLNSPGQPLDTAIRAYFEPRFGFDFSRVRVHSDSKAARSAEKLGAAAYACGDEIVFAVGRYAPGGTSGGRVLAHELAHVVQQADGSGAAVIRRVPANSSGPGAKAASLNFADSEGEVIESPKKRSMQEAAHEMNEVWREFERGGVDKQVAVKAAKYYQLQFRAAMIEETNQEWQAIYTIWALEAAAIIAGVAGGIGGGAVVSAGGGEAAPASVKLAAAGIGGALSASIEVPLEQGIRAIVGEKLLSAADAAKRVAAGASLGVLGEATALVVGRIAQSLRSVLGKTTAPELGMEGPIIPASEAGSTMPVRPNAPTPAIAISPAPSSSEVDEAFAQIEAGNAPQGQGKLLTDLFHHGDRTDARETLERLWNRPLRGTPGPTPQDETVNPNPGYQSAHTFPQSSGRGLPQYDADAMISRLLPTGRGHVHTVFDGFWQADFRNIVRSSGRTTTTAIETFDVVSRAARRAFPPAEAESVIQLLHEDMYVRLGLSPTSVLRIPGT
jgi:hypothetical protein